MPEQQSSVTNQPSVAKIRLRGILVRILLENKDNTSCSSYIWLTWNSATGEGYRKKLSVQKHSTQFHA